MDSEIDQKPCQDLICGNSVSLKNKKVMFEDLINKHRTAFVFDEICIFLY